MLTSSLKGRIPYYTNKHTVTSLKSEREQLFLDPELFPQVGSNYMEPSILLALTAMSANLPFTYGNTVRNQSPTIENSYLCNHIIGLLNQ